MEIVKWTIPEVYSTEGCQSPREAEGVYVPVPMDIDSVAVLTNLNRNNGLA